MQCWLPLCLALAVFPAASVLAADAAGDGKASEEDGGEERSRIFEESVEKLLPVDPGEIRTYIEKRDRVEGAAAPGPARMRTGTRQISAVPGVVPQVIRLTAGYSSTVMFQDATGEPWPVLSIVLGNARAFQATQPKVEAEDGEAQSGVRNRTGTARANVASNVVSLVPLTNHASSNLMVTLEDAPYPVVLHLITESQARRGRVGDALVVFRLDRGGPNAKPAVLAPPAPEAVSADLLEFVHGVPPDGARPVRLEPEYPGTRAWLYRDRIYLRTGHHAVWPAWLSRAGCGGLTVYALPRAPFVVLSVGGERVKLMTGLASGEAGRRHE